MEPPSLLRPVSQLHTSPVSRAAMPTNGIRHVFVYGTLRPALAKGEPGMLIASLQYDGLATVKGQLFDLGKYPGLVDGPGIVHGELLVVETMDQLRSLDAYEECDQAVPLYHRETAIARRPDGTSETVWVYRYCRSLKTAVLILSGDYLSYLTGGGGNAV